MKNDGKIWLHMGFDMGTVFGQKDMTETISE